MSGLDFQTVPIAFTQGQDTRTQPKLSLPGKWQRLINYSLSQDNTPRRRDGSARLVGGSVGNGLALHGNELLAVNGTAISSYSTGHASLKTMPGELGYVNVSKTEVQRANNMQDSPDCASGISGSASSNYTCYVWRDLDQFATPTGIHCTLVDETTGTKLINNFVLRADTSAICPRVVYHVPSGSPFGAFFVFYISGTHLYCRVIDPSSSLTPGAEVALITSAQLANLNFDACAFGSSAIPSVMVVYGWNDGTTSIRSIQVTRTGTVPSIRFGPTNLISEATVAVANVYGMCCASFTSTLTGNGGCFVLHSGGVSGVAIDDTWAVSTAVSVLDAFVPAVGNSHICGVLTTAGASCIQIFSDQQANYGTAGIKPIRTSGWGSTLIQTIAPANLINSASFGGAAGAARGPQGPWICGKPFAGPASASAGGNPVVLLPVCIMENTDFGAGAPNNNTQCTFFLLDGSTAGFGSPVVSGAVVAKALYGSYGVPAINSNPPQVSTPCSSPAIGSSFATLVNERTTLVISNGLNVSPTGLCRLSLTSNSTLPPVRAEFGPVTYFAGGQLTSYDGSGVVEHGFPLFPEGVGAAIAAGAGMTDGVHQIVAVYEWFDAQGKRHQSSPSLPVSVTAGGGNNQATVNVPTLLLSQKQGINVVLYMTEAGSTVFKRLLLRAGHPVPNSTTVAFVTVTVTELDASISGNESLYNQPDQGGSTLPNDAPPPCRALAASRNRLWLLPADNDLEYRYSQELLSDSGLQFSGLYGDITLGGLVPSDSGGTVAIAALDEKTVIFCARKLYVIFGGAPDASGNNNTLSEPEEIPSPVGCSDALSVLAVPQGLIFKAESGWHLLGRDVSVTYIGEGVSSFDGYTVVSATLMRDRQECRFEVTPSGGAGGVTLVFSYLIGQWSVISRGGNLLSPTGAFDALWYPTLQRYVFITRAAPLGLFEDVPLFDDNGVQTGADPDDFVNSATPAQVSTVGQTAWLRVAGLEGFQRVRRLYLTGTPGVSQGLLVASLLTIAVEFDDDSISPFNYTVTVNPLSAAGTTIDIRHKLEHQKCKSVRFTFTEVGLVPNAPVLSGIQALALEVGIKKGVRKLSAGQTV